MRGWDAERIATAAGATLAQGAPGGPERVSIDSRAVGPGDLFVGLVGENTDGGRFARGALEAGAWGVLISEPFAHDLPPGAVLTSPDPLTAMGALARAWRRSLGASVIAVTGSVGKTSTKELIAALLAPTRAVVASRANFNTDIGMPPEILGADPGTEVLVLEAAMRGFGEIATLRDICEPDVAVITNIGPVHLEQVGSLEGVARAKAELLPGAQTVVVPAGEALLEPYLQGMNVTLVGEDVRYDGDTVVAFGEPLDLEVPFKARHHRANTLTAVAACLAVGVRPSGQVELPVGHLRGERIELPGGALVMNDCYNASPLSMRAALDELSSEPVTGRRLAVLGDMLELGERETELHREVGAEATAAGVEVLVTVGPRAAVMLDEFDGEGYAVADAGEAAALVGELLESGDVMLVKGSRGVGLEVVAEALEAAPHG
jgi:UDP-N-acetylmuramoyl-tripeptide--D-alanyl-D-alanine ligase